MGLVLYRSLWGADFSLNANAGETSGYLAACFKARVMIHVTRINQQQLVLNSDLIEHIEATPDTVITMTNGQKLVVVDSAEAVIEKIVEFRRSIHQVPRLTLISSSKDAADQDEAER